MAFLSKSASAAVSSNGSTAGGYLSLSKLPDGGSVRFALLSDEPLEFYESWGQANGVNKPFRFDFEPTTKKSWLRWATSSPAKAVAVPAPQT